MKIAFVIPPTVDVNTPYASGPRLGAWLRHLGHSVEQIDLSLEHFLRVFSGAGLERMFAAVNPSLISAGSEDVYINRDRYIEIIDQVIRFCQGRDLAPLERIVGGAFIPEGPRFRAEGVKARRAAFGTFAKTDYAHHKVGIMLTELVNLFQETISENIALASYGEKLVDSSPSFDPIAAELAREPSVVEEILYEAAAATCPDDVDLVCITCPFPGNLLGGLRFGKWIAENRPGVARALGGGYPSTSLRQIEDPRIFEFIDYLVLDDGEVPLQQICAALEGADVPLHNTFTAEANEVVFHPPTCSTPKFADFPDPDFAGFDFDRYVNLIYRRNHVSRLMTMGSWLKVTAAHGCYWKKCNFCDIHLPYIGDYDPLPASRLADQMDRIAEQTGKTGFHFTDEAAPPKLLVNLALELLRRRRSYHFWGNVRYDKAFTPDVCRLLAAAGMVGVTGGIEVAHDSMLQQIGKGINISQLVEVLDAFSGAGFQTHGYLIYGFPGETPQTCIDGVEVLRQLMQRRLLHSGFFHNLSVTAHSPMGRNPELFKVRLHDEFRGFGRYSIPFEYADGERHTSQDFQALQRVINAYAKGGYLDQDVNETVRHFGGAAFPAPSIPVTFVDDVVAKPRSHKRRGRMCWLGGKPDWSRGLLIVRSESGAMHTTRATEEVAESLARCHPSSWGESPPPKLEEFASPTWVEPFRPLGLVMV